MRVQLSDAARDAHDPCEPYSQGFELARRACMHDGRRPLLGCGLTMGVHSRIESKADDIINKSIAGNTYINRDIVGAVVGSQPFGGTGLSGTGFKAGGPNYLLQFVDERSITKNTVAFGGNAEILNLED